MTSARDLLAGLESDGILRVVDEGGALDRPLDLDPDAALFVLEDAVETVLALLGPALVGSSTASAVLVVPDLPALRGATHLLASALMVHQAAREGLPE